MGVRVSLDEKARSVSVIPTGPSGRRAPWNGGMSLSYADAVTLARQLDALILSGELPEDVPTDRPSVT